VITRRDLLAASLVLPSLTPASARPQSPRPPGVPIVKPRRLQPGDTIGLIGPANATFKSMDLEIATETVRALGFTVRHGRHLLDRYGYLSGRDRDRAADINAFFADRGVHGIFAIRGGWGSARLLPHLDYDAIRQNPKVLLGFSDITALLLAIHARTGLVTFHGPTGLSEWTAFDVESMKRVLMAGEAVTFQNVREVEDTLVPMENRIRTIVAGTARGRLAGGNLTVLTALMGTPFLPDWQGRILFFEDVREQIYRVDRMLTQLALGGMLGRLAGVVVGHCTDCLPGEGYGSLTLEEVLDDHIEPLKVPAFEGAMIGHIDRQFTLPIGVNAEIDAGAGTIRLLEEAVG
jgi:muramoyltetrapeptide carboxypeptidase